MAIARCNVPINGIQRETREHGTPMFPIGFYHDYLPIDDVPWHWHEQLEIGYVEKGRVHLGVNADKAIVREGETFFVNKEILHACWCEDGEMCTMRSTVFKAELLGGQESVYQKNYIRPLVESGDVPYCIFNGQEEWQKKILSLQDRIWKAAADEPFGYEFAIREDLSDILLLILKHMPKKPKELSEKALRTERRMKTMLQYISENYENEIKVEAIAESASISVSECVRCFRDGVGISPIKYVKQLRLQNAAELLTATDASIQDIAARCGFQDMSYFTKSFQEIKGMTPSAFRQKSKSL